MSIMRSSRERRNEQGIGWGPGPPLPYLAPALKPLAAKLRGEEYWWIGDVLKIDDDPTIDLDTITTPKSRRVGDTREERVGSEVRGDGGC
ncbi:hypothetical protein ANCCAN_24051 [Ancylostoma caninum]|uniref:Uncharacterized protein n=1 Tax=Ancylostoma caninum TaxID=29170 RepID=A0A368FGQ9_ANCCA|nr:hypothetical protein ANCCAN_24051 [Ancylostoma caninum]